MQATETAADAADSRDSHPGDKLSRFDITECNSEAATVLNHAEHICNKSASSKVARGPIASFKAKP